MWIEEVRLENIRCFANQTIKFSKAGDPYRWITLLGENGGGKSTVLHALGLLLAGPDALPDFPKPVGWVRDESQLGKIFTRIHRGNQDPGTFGAEKVRKSFGYTFFVTGGKKISIRNRSYTEPTVVPDAQKILSWLRQNALSSKGPGWFAAGYGAFRRLTRSSQIIVPSLETPFRSTNFRSQFVEDEPLATFERWMVYLDYKIAKEGDSTEATRLQKLGISAINKLLPSGIKFDSVSAEGRIYFDVGGQKVPTIALSDGYRSILAFTGDLIWRLILAFPDSTDPLKEEGVVLIDELDIHMHPQWQRMIAGWLREQFPNIQFIVATHSPFIAAGAGEDSLTLRCNLHNGATVVEEVPSIAAMNVDRILQSKAFEVVSPYSPETQRKIDRYDQLYKSRSRSPQQEVELQQLMDFMETARPIGGPPPPDSLEAKIELFLEKKLK